MIKIDESQFVNPQDLTGVYAQPDPVQQEAMICSITTYRAPNKLHVGDGIPHVPLTALADGQSVDLRDLAAKRPLVLFFGSYT
ncbi:MAG: hypothetical protein H6658_13595 [Ardenticatenaceae bacterium]|nr:hypothetical protein [Ardenticatenaceae bacterium]